MNSNNRIAATLLQNDMRAFTQNVYTLYLVITGRKKETQFDCLLD